MNLAGIAILECRDRSNCITFFKLYIEAIAYMDVIFGTEP